MSQFSIDEVESNNSKLHEIINDKINTKLINNSELLFDQKDLNLSILNQNKDQFSNQSIHIQSLLSNRSQNNNLYDN